MGSTETGAGADPGMPARGNGQSQGTAILRCLVKAGRLTDREAEELAAYASDNDKLVDALVREKGLAERDELIQHLENYYYVRSVDPSDLTCEPSALRLLTAHRAKSFRLLPMRASDSSVDVAAADPGDLPTLDSLRALTGRRATPFVMLESELLEAIRANYQDVPADGKASRPRAERRVLARGESKSGGRGGKAPKYPEDDVSRLVDAVVEDACSLGASDIHIEPWADKTTVRFRIDGVRVLRSTLSPTIHPQVASRLKIIGDMDIAERRAPQDGRATFRWNGKPVDLRISTLPSKQGEKVVIRLLFKDPSLVNLEKIGLPGDLETRYREIAAEPIGMILVVGPTGSGKTTTLYATLGTLDSERFNITTLEDPVEYEMANVTQVQVNPKAGLTFLTGLRSLLRQDPDVILVGEMRDTETAEVACRATLTGHKVLSTLHTADACQSIVRLLDMGIPPYLVTASLLGVLAQRLVRRICEHCKEEYPADDAERALLGLAEGTVLHRGAGCDKCVGTGYSGRTGVFELLVMDEKIRRLVFERARSQSVRYAALERGFVTLAERGKQLVQAGVTTVSELERVVLTSESREQFCSNCRRLVRYEFTVCPFCGTALRETCPRCSAPIEPDWEACPACGEPIEHAGSRRYCARCMSVLDRSWDSCPYCGGA